MKKLIASIVSILTLAPALAPALAFAQTVSAPVAYNPSSISNAGDLAAKLTYLFDVAIDLLIAFAILWIIISVVMMFVSGDDGRKAWRDRVIWGIVGLAIILSIWGLVHILTSTFQTSNNTLNAGEIPAVPTIQ
jgi:hypothetical protein